jgi:phage terminase large subunit-like protein
MATTSTSSSADLNLQGWKTYAEDVLADRVIVGEYVRKHVETFVDEILDDSLRWIFDVQEATRFLEFIQTFTTHTRGEWAGRPFILSDWQAYLIANLFGWKERGSDLRRYRTAALFVARKSGKTQLAAAIAVAMAVLDDDAAGEYVFAATKRDQARIGFDEVRRMIQANPSLRRRFEVRRHDIQGPRDSTMKPLASDSNRLDGLSLNLGVVDELHGMRDGDLLRVIKSSQGSRRNGLTLAITTAGFITDGPAAQIMKTGKDVLDGIKDDDRTLCLIYQIDEGDDWKDPEIWIKANPGLGTSISEEYLRSQCKQAQNHGGRAVVEFQTKHANQFVASSSEWIGRDAWRSCRSDADPEPGAEVFLGLDLASVSDFTACALIFPIGTDEFLLRVHYFLPERAIERKLEADESSIYATFTDQPNVHVTPGNVTDFDFVRNWITGHKITEDGRVIYEDALATKYTIRALAFDRYNSSQLITDLTNDGIDCAPFGMGFVSQSAPTKNLERLILGNMIHHDGDAVTEWMFGNVALQYDPAGNVKITKSRSGKVDGVVAAVMALGEWMTFDAGTNEPLPDDLIRLL